VPLIMVQPEPQPLKHGYCVAPTPPPVEFERTSTPIQAEPVPPGFITVILNVWREFDVPPANEKLTKTVCSRFTVDGLAKIVPVTAQPEWMRMGVRTRESTAATTSNLAFRSSFKPDRATATPFSSGH